jgi:type VI secretion system protein
MRTFAILVLAVLAGCSSPPKTKVKRIDVVAELHANRNMATALDIVFVYDEAAAALLPRTGPEWFERKAALVSGLASAIDVVSLQVPPAMKLEVPMPKNRGNAIGVYSYANYVEPAGQPMGNLTPFREITIGLAPDRINYRAN